MMKKKTIFYWRTGGWYKKEPKNFTLTILCSIPLMIFLSLISVGIISFFSPILLQDFGMQQNGLLMTINFPDIIVALIIIYAIIYIHEIIHLIFIPDFFIRILHF